MMTKKVVWK